MFLRMFNVQQLLYFNIQSVIIAAPTVQAVAAAFDQAQLAEICARGVFHPACINLLYPL